MGRSSGLARRRVVLVVLACGGATLAGCGAAKSYVPLTAANLGTTMTVAIKDLHTAHEVSTSNGITTTIDFDSSGALKYRITRSSSGSSPQSLIAIGADRYLQGSGAVPATKWLKLPISSGAPVITFNDVNPVGMVTRFDKAIKQFAYIGPTKIAGADVQHYTIVVDQRKYLQSTGQGLGSANLGSAETFTEDLYLNGDNTLRRVSLALPGGVGNTQVDVTNWGKPITIQAPPASAIATSVSSTK